jgi:ABC-type cobalamin/Fe3+-siderophores transport system ATPase subunit
MSCGLDEALSRFLANSTAPGAIAALAKAIRSQLNRFRTYGPVEGQLRAWLRELQWAVDTINRRYLHRPIPLRRVSPRGGTVIVLLGSDGSGKSTLCKSLVGWLGVKLDVVPIYFGSGDGHSAIYRTPLRMAHRLLTHFSRSRVTPPALQPGKNGYGVDPVKIGVKTSWLRSFARVPWAIALSFEKRGKLKRMIRARNLGLIVICDRFPQAISPGFNDGPLLSRWRDHPWSIFRALANWEAKPYADAGLDPPDVVLKLTVSPEIALGRRPDMPIHEIQRRVAVVQAMTFLPPAVTVEICADLQMEQVAREAKRAVWDKI